MNIFSNLPTVCRISVLAIVSLIVGAVSIRTLRKKEKKDPSDTQS